jgi:hypothetical protein
MRAAFPLRIVPLLLLLLDLALAGGLSAQSPAAAGASSSPVQIDVVPFSHLDFFWGGTREECLARGNQIIAKAIQIAKQYPEFRFLIEDIDFTANYVESHQGAPELEDFKRLVKEGRLEIAPKWAAIFQNIPNGEVHARNFIYGKGYARTVFGVDPKVAHLGDLPGYTPQFPQLAVKSDVPYMVMTRMGPSDKSLFNWKSPDGSKVLLWYTLSHYGWGSHLGLHATINNQRKEEIRKEVERVQKIFDGPIFMSWGSDLWAPTAKLVENLKLLNQELPPLRFGFATPTEYFHQVAKWPGVPDVSGEIPSSWPNVLSSLPHLWSPVLTATNTLLAAERFAALNYALGYADYPQSEFDFLWKKLIESTDHNHDGQGGKTGDDRKIEYSRMSIERGGEILRDSLRNIAERVEFAVPNSHAIVVFNPLGWRRDDVVTAHATLYGPVSPRDIDDYKKALRLVDEKGQSVPFHLEEYSENISRALVLSFIARDIPSLGYRTYYLVPGERPESLPPAAQFTSDADNDRRDPRRPMGADVLENSYYRLTVDRPTGRVTIFDKELNRDVAKDLEVVALEERGGNYIGIEPLSGRTIPNAIDRVRLEENNGLRAVLRIDGQIVGMPVTQRYTLYRDAKRVDLENTIEWRRPRFLRVQQLFPYTAANAKIHYGVPFGAVDSGDILPNAGPHMPDEISKESWLASRQIQDWIWAGTPEGGLTIASDHQLMKLSPGVLRAEMLRGARFSSAKVVRGEEVTSMFYPVPGTYRFRFSLSSARGDWKAAKSYHTGMNFNNGLIPVEVVDNVSRKTLPPVRSFLGLNGDHLVLSALKKADQDSSMILRFFEMEGTPAETGVEFLGRRAPVQEMNILEEAAGQAGQSSVRVGPYEIKTLKLPVER